MSPSVETFQQLPWQLSNPEIGGFRSTENCHIYVCIVETIAVSNGSYHNPIKEYLKSILDDDTIATNFAISTFVGCFVKDGVTHVMYAIQLIIFYFNMDVFISISLRFYNILKI